MVNTSDYMESNKPDTTREGIKATVAQLQSIYNFDDNVAVALNAQLVEQQRPVVNLDTLETEYDFGGLNQNQLLDLWRNDAVEMLYEQHNYGSKTFGELYKNAFGQETEAITLANQENYGWIKSDNVNIGDNSNDTAYFIKSQEEGELVGLADRGEVVSTSAEVLKNYTPIMTHALPATLDVLKTLYPGENIDNLELTGSGTDKQTGAMFFTVNRLQPPAPNTAEVLGDTRRILGESRIYLGYSNESETSGTYLYTKGNDNVRFNIAGRNMR